MVHPDDVAKVKALLSSIGDNSDEIDDFVIRFKDKNDNYRWVRWMGRLDTRPSWYTTGISGQDF